MSYDRAVPRHIKLRGGFFCSMHIRVLHALKYLYPVQYTCRDARSERPEDVHRLQSFV